ncbi:MAG: LCP family protein [Symbiobacteriia bacterium]
MKHAKTQVRIRWPRLLLVIGVLLLAPALLLSLAFYGYFRFGSFEHVNATKPHTEPGGPPVAADPDAANRHTILVMGEHQGLSDTMILLSVDKVKGAVGALWIPRDTKAFIPGKNKDGVPYGFDKINAANAYWTDDVPGGMTGHQRAMQAVSDLLGVQVDDFVQVDIKSFENIVDTLGGVDINVPFAMDYDDPWDTDGGFHVHLKKGPQHLTGQQALGFVRWRHNNDETIQYESGDIGRIGAQQQFAQALLKQLLRGRTLARLPALVPQLSRGVKTSLDVGQMVELARELQGIDLNTGVRRASLPGEAAYEHGVSYFIAAQDQASQVVDWVIRFKEKPAFLQDGNARAGDVTVTKPKPPAPATTPTSPPEQRPPD